MDYEIYRLIEEKYKESKQGLSLEMMRLLNTHKYQSWLAEVTPEAARNIEQREQEKKEKEEKQRKEERERIEKSWKEAQERKQEEEQERKQEEEREKQLIVSNTESPDKPLTLQNIRDLNAGFDINTMRRVLEELNVEMLKRIVRRGYAHKFIRI